MKLKSNDFTTRVRGTDNSEYQLYLDLAGDAQGLDITTGKPLKTYEEWLGS